MAESEAPETEAEVMRRAEEGIGEPATVALQTSILAADLPITLGK